jgi:[acyl-carrier-protein] S-malonyltransferase
MQCLLDQGIDAVVELGAGKVLSGLMRRFNKEIKCFQVGDPDSLQRTVEALR